MPIININVKEKIAKGNKDEFIVCNNSDYEILFDFDEEWQEYNHKTAIVTLSNREFVPILFDGNKCKLPPLQNATFCKIGVMASLENDDATIRISTTTPASINCLESAYDENGEILPPTDDIYQQILAKLNDINTNISRGGTSVTVGGVVQDTWSADSKVDKATTVSGGFNLYGTKYNDPTTQMWQIDSGNATQSRIPMYFLADNASVNESGEGCLVTSTPKYDAHATNKKYVDDGLSGKVPITPDGFPSTYAGLFGKTGDGKIEIVSKIGYWDGIESLPNYNINGSIAAYSHRATGENVLYTGTPDMPSQATNKLYVDTALDGKLDKATSVDGGFNLYGTNFNNPTTLMFRIDSGMANLSAIPMYYSSDNEYVNAQYGGVLATGTPKYDAHATNKKYVDDGLSGKVDKVTTAYKIYGTDGNGNQKAYATGWSATVSLFQLMDGTPNGGYEDNGNFDPNINGTYMVGIPYKPSHATPKKWVEDNFTVYKHIVSISVSDYGLIDWRFIVYSSQSTPFTTETLPSGVYVGWSGDGYNFLISNHYGSIIATKLFGTVDNKRYLLDDDLYIDSDTVTKL